MSFSDITLGGAPAEAQLRTCGEGLLQGGLALTWASQGGVRRGVCEEQDTFNISLRSQRKNCGQMLATAPPSGSPGLLREIQPPPLLTFKSDILVSC